MIESLTKDGMRGYLRPIRVIPDENDDAQGMKDCVLYSLSIV